MSDTVSKSDYDRLNAQFMTLQRELELARKKPDASAIIQGMVLNPLGTLKGAGYGDDVVEHMRQVLIADKLGPQAPMQMQMAASQGPMMMQFQALAKTVAELADRVSNTTTAAAQSTEREKFKGIVTNASKNPHLTKAYAKNPEKYIGLLSSQGGTAEDFIAKQEAELKEIAEALGIVKSEPAGTPAASENAGKQGEGKNTTIVSAQSGLLNDVPVPKPGMSPEGTWNKGTYQALKAKLVEEANKPPGNR